MPEQPLNFASELTDQTAQFADLVDGADLDRPVPSCPEWRLGTLVEHVGQGHRFGAERVRARLGGPLRRVDATPVPLPGDPAQHRDWLLAGAENLVGAVREAGAEPVWNFAFGEGDATFWLRRMAHETALHRWDAALALHAEFELAPEVAADALSEWLTLLTSPGAAQGRPEMAEALRGTGQTIHLHATDQPGLGEAGEWLLTRGPDQVSWRHGHAKGDVAARGLAVDLLLLMVNRIRPADPRTQAFGDAELLEHWSRVVDF